MKLIIPMAGRGSRLRPHTLTVPKPLIKIAGKPIVQRLAEDIANLSDEPIEEIAFVIGDFGEEAEAHLREVGRSLGAQANIYYQQDPLGTAHAILCAADSLDGKVIVAFADTLFRADFKLDTSQDGIIWVHHVEDPRKFGVVKKDENGIITEFIEKPETPVSNEAIIGIYFFHDGSYLRKELQYLLDNNIREKGEFQLTNALENMKQQGAAFTTGTVEEWLDCGNKEATVHTNRRILEFMMSNNELSNSGFSSENSLIIPPCNIGKGTVIRNSLIGPYVSLGQGCEIDGCIIENSLIQDNTFIKYKNLAESMIGSHVNITGKPADLSVGDYTEMND